MWLLSHSMDPPYILSPPLKIEWCLLLGLRDN